MRQRRGRAGSAEQGEREVEVLSQVAQRELRRVAIREVAGTPGLERGHEPLEDPEHLIGVQARGLAGHLQLRRRQEDVGSRRAP